MQLGAPANPASGRRQRAGRPVRFSRPLRVHHAASPRPTILVGTTCDGHPAIRRRRQRDLSKGARRRHQAPSASPRPPDHPCLPSPVPPRRRPHLPRVCGQRGGKRQRRPHRLLPLPRQPAGAAAALAHARPRPLAARRGGWLPGGSRGAAGASGGAGGRQAAQLGGAGGPAADAVLQVWGVWWGCGRPCNVGLSAVRARVQQPTQVRRCAARCRHWDTARGATRGGGRMHQVWYRGRHIQT